MLAGAASPSVHAPSRPTVTSTWRGTAALLMDEHIEYAFSGPFSGGYRDVPVRPGEKVSGVSVLENGRAVPAGWVHRSRLRRPGRHLRRRASRRASADRLAQHALDETRTFEIRYRLSGARRRLRRRRRREPARSGATSGSWAARPADRDPGRARGRSSAPGGTRSTCAATWCSTGKRRDLRALDVPAHQFVELRARVPRSAFTSTPA